MPKRSDRPATGRPRPSSHLRLSNTTVLYSRFAAAETVILRRLRQLDAIEARLRETEVAVPARAVIKPPERPGIPAQFGSDAQLRKDRSATIVAAAIKLLKGTTHKTRSPSKREIVKASKLEEVDPEGKGVSLNVFRTNQDCLDHYLAACLPKDAERRKSVAVPSWAVRMENQELIKMVMQAELDRDQLTRDLMAANELHIAPEVARIRKEVVLVKAKKMLEAVD